MHELSIAMSLVEASCQELARQCGTRVESLHVRIGRLSGVIPTALASAFELAAEGTPIQGAGIIIEEAPVRVLCPCCGDERPVRKQVFRCADCGTATPDVVSGRELEIVSLEISNITAEC